KGLAGANERARRSWPRGIAMAAMVASDGRGTVFSEPRRSHPFYNCSDTSISTLLAAGAKPLFVCRQTGTSLEIIEKRYGDARVAAVQLDKMLREFVPPTSNPVGTLSFAPDRASIRRKEKFPDVSEGS